MINSRVGIWTLNPVRSNTCSSTEQRCTEYQSRVFGETSHFSNSHRDLSPCVPSSGWAASPGPPPRPLLSRGTPHLGSSSTPGPQLPRAGDTQAVTSLGYSYSTTSSAVHKNISLSSFFQTYDRVAFPWFSWLGVTRSGQWVHAEMVCVFSHPDPLITRARSPRTPASFPLAGQWQNLR